MPINYSLYNLTSGDITIDDIPVQTLVPAHASAAIDPGNSQLDVLNSWLIRERCVENELQLSVNGHAVDYKSILHGKKAEK